MSTWFRSLATGRALACLALDGHCHVVPLLHELKRPPFRRPLLALATSVPLRADGRTPSRRDDAIRREGTGDPCLTRVLARHRSVNPQGGVVQHAPFCRPEGTAPAPDVRDREAQRERESASVVGAGSSRSAEAMRTGCDAVELRATPLRSPEARYARASHESSLRASRQCPRTRSRRANLLAAAAQKQ